MNSGSSAPTHSTVQVERCLRISSSSQKSRPARMGEAWSVRRATSTVRTVSSPSTARSTVSFSLTTLPPRRPSFAVTTTWHCASRMRSRIASALKPPKMIECTAPRRAQASIV